MFLKRSLKFLKISNKHHLNCLPKYIETTKLDAKVKGIVMPLYGLDLRRHIKDYFSCVEKSTRMPESLIKEFGVKMIN